MAGYCDELKPKEKAYALLNRTYHLLNDAKMSKLAEEINEIQKEVGKSIPDKKADEILNRCGYPVGG